MLRSIPGDNTYSNYQEANRAFYRQVLPKASEQDWHPPRHPHRHSTYDLALSSRAQCGT